ncbi:hypothetical protein ABZ208_35265 [Streptomyces sp. NPDC006208]|uniref:hypothetical protein n=1 Tax=Streptomyces sp. NPDC006208 TaxID=3156734 RepID=UPI0033AE9998
MTRRRRSLEAFYTGPVWRKHRDAANATMIDSDDVLLLRSPGFTSEPGTREVVATVCHPSDAAAFDAYAARHLGPGHALHRTEQNDYPVPRPHRGGRPGLVRPGGVTPWPTRRLRLEPVTT